MFNIKNKLFFGTMALGLILFLSGCQNQAAQELNLNTNEQEPASEQLSDDDQPLIGGDQDEHGCLIAAGYSWCQTKDKCLRVWEEPCPVSQDKVYQPVVLEDLEWKKYTNDTFGYSLDYPTTVNIMGNDLDEQVEFNGPLVDNEWWPQISISHYSSDFYRPNIGADVGQWVKPFPGYKSGEDISIAGLKTVHYVQTKTPQTWATDYFYFIKNGQLYNITIIHSNDRQDWPLYNKILNSFSFDN